MQAQSSHSLDDPHSLLIWPERQTLNQKMELKNKEKWKYIQDKNQSLTLLH